MLFCFDDFTENKMFSAKKRKIDGNVLKFSTVNGALNILLFHIAKVLSASSANI